MPLRRSDWRSLLTIIISNNLQKTKQSQAFDETQVLPCDNRGILQHKLCCTHWRMLLSQKPSTKTEAVKRTGKL
ncbi:MAG: hypothetical protein KME54_14320 [Tolypothrix brevis GSE-NOS-MK-07-07A]|jgi:hypothetical protein|nr:hypothetical protein [Tolypothrix brevis GSE-NOS-MK-07-07A]